MTIHIRVGFKGSSTSGNFGHAGRPGHLGGSVAKHYQILDRQSPDEVLDPLLAEVKQWEGARKNVGLAALDIAQGQTTIVTQESAETVAVAKIQSGSFWQPQELPEVKDWIEVSDLATKRAGYGRQAMRDVCQVAATRGAGVCLVAAYSARTFYDRIGMHLAEGATNKYYFSPDEAKAFYYGAD